MRDKRIKLIYFSLKGSEVKDFALGWRKILLFSSMLLVILTILIGAGLSLFTDIYHDSQVVSLQKLNQSLLIQLEEMGKNLHTIRMQVKQLEGDDDEIRMIAGLDTIGQDVREAGVGGPEPAYSNELNLFPGELRDEISVTRGLIDQLERKIQMLRESREEIKSTLERKQAEIKHLPTIQPLRGGRISSRFGQRVDPFTEKLEMHRGLDIAAREGTPVHASADGVVVRVNRSYKPNKGYGKLVVIDHGNGIQTKYAHLSKIAVRPGQKVKRWDKIGEVGQTGRANGSHLHYEVIVYNKQVDPVRYFFE